MRHIITLSTIPPRFGKLGPALRSLVSQSSRPEAVELYIPRTYRRFPQWGGALPEVPEGVTIVRVDEDLGPATKVLPAAKAWRGQDVELIYVDDDRVFAQTWAERCLGLRKDHPGAVICGAGFNIGPRFGYKFAESPHPQAVPAITPDYQFGFLLNKLLRRFAPRGTRWAEVKGVWRRFDQSGHVNIAEGFGGVMVQPGFFDDLAFDIPPVLWTVDDIWLSGMVARKGIPIWADKDLFDIQEVIDTSAHFPLYKAVIEGADRDAANVACIDYMRETYGIWGGEAVQRI